VLAGHAPVVVWGMVVDVEGTQKLPCSVDPLGQVSACGVVGELVVAP
jgi:hypothetical protein